MIKNVKRYDVIMTNKTKKNDGLKAIAYSMAIIMYYIFMNFIMYDIYRITEGEYLFFLIINVLICIAISASLESNDNLSIKIGKHFAILLVCLWLTGYELFVAQEYTTKITGISLFIGGNSLIFLLTKGAWPFSSPEGRLFLDSNKVYCISLIILLIVLLVISVSLLVFGEWVFRG